LIKIFKNSEQVIEENNNVVDNKKYNNSTKEDIEAETTYTFPVNQ
jgi:hypothetical protein